MSASSGRRPRPSITRRDLLPDLGVAAVAVAVTTALYFLMLAWLGEKPPLILFSAMAAALTFWRGLGPGILAIALGTPVGTLLIQPPGGQAARNGYVPLEISLMFAGSMFICWLIYRLKVEREGVDAVEDQRKHALAFVSHELRQPLASVHLAAEMLERDGSDETRLRAAELIQGSAARLSRVVDDLVELTRLQGEGLRIDTKTMRLQEAVFAAATASSAAIVHRRQYLQTSAPETPLWINGDAARLRQVFDNLLSNASLYSPEGAEISILTREENGRAVVVVRDSGIGLRRDMLERIFEPFVREFHNGVEGLGLGLTLARNLVTTHGGRITAHSDGPGRGTMFVVDLPLVPAPAPVRPPHRNRENVSTDR